MPLVPELPSPAEKECNQDFLRTIALDQYCRQKQQQRSWLSAFGTALMCGLVFFGVGALLTELGTPDVDQDLTPLVQSADLVPPTEILEPAVIATPTTIPTPQVAGLAVTPTPTIEQDELLATASAAALSKDHYTVAIIGDSMVDTMGEHLDYLQKALKSVYPNTEFTLYNYGIGSENVEMGAERFEKPFDYQTRQFDSIPKLNPDVLVVASFAYNPFPPHDRQKHWTTLAGLVSNARKTGINVYLLAEIAPQYEQFGVGGIDWPLELRKQQATAIVEQLENAIGLSASMGVPLIDAYHPSIGSGRFGTGVYTNQDDGIHPSVAGHKLMAELIAETLEFE